MTTLSDDQIKYARYKWEFLRRNPEYIKDWEKLVEVLEEFWFGPGRSAPGELMIKEEIEFCKKWKIACQLPPESSYYDFTDGIYEGIPPLDDEEEEEDVKGIDFNSLSGSVDERSLVSLGYFDVHRCMYERLFPEFILLRPFRVEDGWEYELDGEFGVLRRFSYKVAQSGILTVKIDLNHSKNRLINDFKDFINEWKKMYEKAFINFRYEKFCEERDILCHPIDDEETKKEFEEIYLDRLKERKEKYEKKYHFDNFDLYLQVYDLRQEGKSWAKIANELNLNSPQTARNHHKAAKELIEKGIELYVK